MQLSLKKIYFFNFTIYYMTSITETNNTYHCSSIFSKLNMWVWNPILKTRFTASLNLVNSTICLPPPLLFLWNKKKCSKLTEVDTSLEAHLKNSDLHWLGNFMELQLLYGTSYRSSLKNNGQPHKKQAVTSIIISIEQ